MAAFSSSAVRRPVTRARMMARPASARVRAEVTCCVPRGIFFMTAASRSSSAATRALDSMYRTLAWVAMGPVGRPGAAFGAERCRRALRFATIGVDEFRGRTRRQADVGPVLERVARLRRRVENAGGNELVPSTSGGLARRRSWRHEFSDDAPMSGHRNPLSRFNASNISAQVVPELANSRLHGVEYSHMWPHRQQTLLTNQTASQTDSALLTKHSLVDDRRAPGAQCVVRRPVQLAQGDGRVWDPVCGR